MSDKKKVGQGTNQVPQLFLNPACITSCIYHNYVI